MEAPSPEVSRRRPAALEPAPTVAAHRPDAALPGGAAAVLALQRFAGNAATAALIGRTKVQRSACCSSCAGGGSCEDVPTQGPPEPVQRLDLPKLPKLPKPVQDLADKLTGTLPGPLKKALEDPSGTSQQTLNDLTDFLLGR
jgi:hypothetical protein